APVIITSFEPANKSVFNEGQRIKISLNASDADNQTLNYTIKIDGVMCSKSSSCIWNTSYSSSGNHTIEVTASDGIEVVKKINTIYINDYHPRWDVNEDGVVDFLDINIIAQNYGTIPKAPYPDWDVNQDGVINLGDLLLAESHFGEKVV
ncbi:MAG: Ig-like domain-containing protein, partial [Methanosarcina sp.]